MKVIESFSKLHLQPHVLHHKIKTFALLRRLESISYEICTLYLEKKCDYLLPNVSLLYLYMIFTL